MNNVIYLENLPLKGKFIDWHNTIGSTIKGIYKDMDFSVEIVDYDGKYLHIKYLDKDIFKIGTGNFSKCKLGKLFAEYTIDFKIEIGSSLKDNKKDLIILDREYRERVISIGKPIHEKWYKYKCNKCGYDEGWIVESNLLIGAKGCSCCKGMTTVEGINDIPTTAPWMVKYFQGGYDEAKLYTKSSGLKITPICDICGQIKDKEIKISDINKTHSIGCPNCSDGMSFPNKIMFNLLEQLKYLNKINEFETEQTFDWLKFEFNDKIRKGRLDFYFEINSVHYGVEMDGSFHSKDNSMNGQTKEESKFIDNEKDRLCLEQGVKVIRIESLKSELEYIKNNIMQSNLSELLNFKESDIDWLKCEEFACNSLVKIICEYKKNNPDSTTSDICKIMNLAKTTTIRYLKQGSKLNWCDYDVKKERKNKGKKISGNNHYLSRKVICLNTLEEFDTAVDAKNKYNASKICECCMGKRKSSGKHKITNEPLMWMYYDEYLKEAK